MNMSRSVRQWCFQTLDLNPIQWDTSGMWYNVRPETIAGIVRCTHVNIKEKLKGITPIVCKIKARLRLF